MFRNRLIQINQTFQGKIPFVMSNCRVFFDFDNTMTVTDVLDNIIKNFSITDEWKALQKLWEQGEIGTKECLEGQLRRIRISRKQLSQYLTKVELDHNTYKILSFLTKEGIPPVVLSDNFTPIIEEILNNHGIKNVKIYANALRFYKDHLIPSFPYDNPFCPSCAHCKKIHLTREQHVNKLIVYIGDGRSDFCPAEVSDIVFAKDRLLTHMKKTGKEHIPYKNLGEVYNYFKEAVYGTDVIGS
jgi:2-hydroxy-3-keto-5-methylthiopentenyl-1-phosphate phosphatase